MKRIAIIALLALCVAAIPVSHQVLANGNSNKVAVCHFPDGEDTGNVIEVSSNGSAVEKHITLHGDSTNFKLDKEGNCVAAKECDPKQEKGCKCTIQQEKLCAKQGGTLNEDCICVLKEEPGCTKEQVAKCNELGGVLNKLCECVIEDKPKEEECTKEQALKCAEQGGVLNKLCECVIEDKPKEEECTKEQSLKCAELGGVLNSNCECVIEEKPKEEEKPTKA